MPQNQCARMVNLEHYELTGLLLRWRLKHRHYAQRPPGWGFERDGLITSAIVYSPHLWVERYPHFDVECCRTGTQRGGMPLIRDQLKSDMAMARLTAHSTFEFRPIVALAFVVAGLGAGAIALFGQGISAWVAGGVSLSSTLVGLYRLRKERALLGDYELAVATVSQRTLTEMETGYSYSVRYRFLGSDGKVYIGKSGSTGKVLPDEGETVPVLYRRSDPNQNSTLATFWFYRFTYTGTE